MFRSLGWAPTIALSWLWGLGFFYSFQVTLANGLVGFLAFAIPNALGFCAFGWILGSRRRDPAAIFSKVEAKYTGLFLAAQIIAVAITLFTAMVYLLIPLYGPAVVPVAASFILLTLAIGHKTSIDGLKSLHCVYLAVGVAAAVAALVGLTDHAPRSPVLVMHLDDRLFGLIVPSIVGFAMAPWTDVQQWQRAAAIHAGGGSVRSAYGWGAALFFCLLGVNAALAVAAGPGSALVGFDGIPGYQRAVAEAAALTGSAPLKAAFTIWVAVAVASTLDSFYAATRWLLRSTVSTSNSPLLIMVPQAIVTSPLWYFVTAATIAFAVAALNIPMLYLMVPFATILAGPAACLLCEALGGKRHYDATLCALIGLAAFVILVSGYVTNSVALMTVAPLIALVGSLDAVRDSMRRRGSASPAAAGQPPAVVRAAATDVVEALEPTFAKPIPDVLTSHGFEEDWFVLHVTPTYDDTNSVGNVYFANYMRWVGKTRELFFNACMPNFDLQNTGFYVLTKDFHHDFRREVKEFQPVTVRLKIGSFNRKFVTLVHEIHSRTEGLIGKGEQSLMFVDTASYKPLDMPPAIVQGFFPYLKAATPAREGFLKAALAV